MDDACIGVRCAEGERCRAGVCRVVLCAANTGCHPTEACVQGRCAQDACLGVRCAPGLVCREGGCSVVTCSQDLECGDGEACGTDGRCVVTGGCAALACPSKQVCRDGACGVTACRADPDCAQAEVCRDGACLGQDDACANITPCPPGQVCRSGACEAASCGPSRPCLGAEQCRDGVCQPPLLLEQATLAPAAGVVELEGGLQSYGSLGAGAVGETEVGGGQKTRTQTAP